MRFSLFFLITGFCISTTTNFAQSSLGFNGVDSYVQIPDESSLQLHQFTLECWIQINGDGNPVQTGEGGVEAVPIITKGTEDPEAASGINYFLGIRALDHVLVFDYELSASAEIPYLNQPVVGVTSLKNDVWYHIAVSFNGTDVSIYLNGKLEALFETWGLPFLNAESDLGIGTAFDKTNAPNGRFSGHIDALRIWNSALSQEQLLQNINSEITSSVTGMVMALNFNEGEGSTTNSEGEISPGSITLVNTTWEPEAGFDAMIPPLIEEEKIMSIGLIADPQYCDCPEGPYRKYRLSLEKLPKAIDTINSRNVDFTVSLGDVIDRYYSSYDAILPLYESLVNPVYFLLGNHEFDLVEDALKDEVTGRLNMPNYYYDFEFGNWKFLVLDGTEMAEYTSVLHPELEEEADSMRERVTGWVNDYVWNGGFSRNQLSWIERQLDSSLAHNQHVILYCHWPVYPFNTYKNLWNDTAVVNLLERYSNVVAYIDGHNHAGNYGVKNNIHYVNQVAMVETAEYNSFQTLDIYPEKLVFDGFGLNRDKILSIRDDFKIMPSPILTENTLRFHHQPGSYIGKLMGISEKSKSYLIGDTALYQNNFFTLVNDSLFLKSDPDYEQQSLFDLKVGIIDNVFDTASTKYTLEFDPTVYIQKRDLTDTLISLKNAYSIPFNSFLIDYSKEGLSYELDIENEEIISGSISDTSILFNPLKFGSSRIILNVMDPYTGENFADAFILSVFDPDNNPPFHLDNLKILIPTEDTLNILLDTLFFDVNNDELFYEISSLSDPTVHYTQTENKFLRIWSDSATETSITIICSDQRGGFDTLSLNLLFNHAPVVQQPIPDYLIQLADPEVNISLTSIFEDPDEGELNYSFTMNNDEIAELTLDSDEFSIRPLSPGKMLIHIIATDDFGATVTNSFNVRINGPPNPANEIIALYLLNDKPYLIYLDTLFSDPEGDSLSFSYSLLNPGICFADLNGYYLELTAINAGETQLIINASDGFGALAQLELKVFVTGVSSTDNAIKHTTEFLIYPNPSNDRINIHFEALPHKIYTFRLIDHTGRTIRKFDHSSDAKSFEKISFSAVGLPPGVYFLHVLDKGKVISIDKIIRQ